VTQAPEQTTAQIVTASCLNDCNGARGVCDLSTSVCTCGSGFSGPDCSVMTCPGNLTNTSDPNSFMQCNGNGNCTETVTSGVASAQCSCSGIWTGTACGFMPSGWAEAFVDCTLGPAGEGSASAPFNSLGQAVSAVASGGTIYISPGTCANTAVSITRNLIIKVHNGAPGSVVLTPPASKVSIMSMTGVTVELRGIKFKDGNSFTGAAINARRSELTVYDCAFEDNSASGWLGYGGAITITGYSKATFYRCARITIGFAPASYGSQFRMSEEINPL
jgi:hypothetical protein